MTRKRALTLALVVLALAIPTAALAAKPAPPVKCCKARVTYVLKGTLSTFTAASTSANGSVTINVTHSNYHAHALVGHQLTFAIAMTTPTNLMGGTILNGAHGIVKFREFKNMTNANLMAALTATTPMTASQIIAH